jgi:hypothetical protein
MTTNQLWRLVEKYREMLPGYRPSQAGPQAEAHPNIVAEECLYLLQKAAEYVVNHDIRGAELAIWVAQNNLWHLRLISPEQIEFDRHSP